MKFDISKAAIWISIITGIGMLIISYKSYQKTQEINALELELKKKQLAAL